MTAERLHGMLVDAGLNVRQYTGWETRGRAWARGEPVGVMQHHTAAPVPYPVSRLAGTLIKCNVNTKPNGEVWLVSYGACNYSSGSGLSQVLAEVLAGTPPDANARARGFEATDDDINGNPYFWNFENDHWGHGEPMPAVQSRAITVATEVSNAYWGLTAGNTISHAEWTARKSDPYWDGDRRVIETIRNSLEEDMPLTAEDLAQIRAIVREEIDARVGPNVWQYLIDDAPTGQEIHTNTALRRIRNDTAALASGGATAEEIIAKLGEELTD